MFTSHTAAHQSASMPTPVSAVKQRLPKIDRPELKQDTTDEDWATFEAEWKRFKRCTHMTPDEIADQLFQCCERSLGRLLLKENPEVIESGEAELLEAMRKMAVIKVATSVRRANLLSHKQDHGEAFREFYANVRSAACTCDYKVQCPHDCCRDKPRIDYTLQVVKDVLIAGIADGEIRKDVLGWSELDQKSDKEVVAFVEEKETARNAYSGTSTSAMSGYRRNRRNDFSRKDEKNNDDKNKRNDHWKSDSDEKKKLALREKCITCKADFHTYTKFRSGFLNKEPFTLCQKCFKVARNASTESESCAIISFIASLDVSPSLVSAITDEMLGDGMDEGIVQVSDEVSDEDITPQMSVCAPIELDHHIFTRDGWGRANSLKHPTVCLKVSTAVDDYLQLGYRYVPIVPKSIDVVADSGAQSCLWSRKLYLRCGFVMEDLIPVNHNMKAANKAPIEIDGAILLRLAGKSSCDESWEAAVMVYISPQANSFFLSKEAMVQLGIIPSSFPCVGSTGEHLKQFRLDAVAVNVVSEAITVPLTATSTPPPKESGIAACGCQTRKLAPERPKELPFAPTLENVPKMKSYLLKRYASSSFNQCPHQELPSIDAPMMKFHVNVDKETKPVSLKTPATVPLHWQDKVYADLERDIALGVLERVPYGEPTQWCFRMVVSRKHDGSPRRTVDLSPLNRFCEREVHPSQSPFQVVHSIPKDSVKTVFDAWNSFHSVPIAVEDRHYTTFITPWGLYRYKRAPQGYLASGDGFTRRFDDLVAHFTRLARIIDDSCLHDQLDDLETHWWRTIEFLEVCGNSGVVLNVDKFQFSQTIVNFAGFRVSCDTVEPLPKYLDAIRNYPTPRNITDIRSWFGLVNQVSHYSQLRDMMEPFRQFLSPKVDFEWTEDLDALFELSKEKIVDAIREGVRIYDPSKLTALSTDYSKTGIGFWLLQRHCNCEHLFPGCCDDGWHIVLAGSRFLSRTEANYCPLEGEALGVSWGLEQTRYFTLGCNDLLVVVNHEPLVKILGDRRLDEIDNPRMFRLKQRTLMWRFRIIYRPGSKNDFSDAISRHPNPYAELASLAMQSDEDRLEESLIAGIAYDIEKFFAITWERVVAESKKDDVIRRLNAFIVDGFPSSKSDMPAELSDFWDYRADLRVVEGSVAVYKDRIVLPAAFRHLVLENLHSAEQGVSSMMSRAQCTVFWPGLSVDLENVRKNCGSCHRNAPSQAPSHPTDPDLPEVPFEMIFADYFKLSGKFYLIIGDRLSGWTEVIQVHHGGATSGSKGLCSAFRRIFATFGVPREISSDGGPEFTASASLELYGRWGIHHRLSSAYNPKSNGRAEVAVKATKRLLEKNIGPDGTLNSDKVVRALLQVRNTPDRDCKLSPAEILFGRRLRDATPQLDKNLMIFANPTIDQRWHTIWAAKELAIGDRAAEQSLRTGPSFKDFEPLKQGDTVSIQNQNSSSRNPKKWDRQGEVVATGQFDQYLVRVNGSGRLTLRNRRFFRKVPYRPLHPTVTRPPVNDHSTPTRLPPRLSAEPLLNNSGQTPPPALHDSELLRTQNTPQEQLPGEGDMEDIGTGEATIDTPRRQVVDTDRAATTRDVTEDTAPTHLRRSNRQMKRTQFYDASTGRSTHANDGAELEGDDG